MTQLVCRQMVMLAEWKSHNALESCVAAIIMWKYDINTKAAKLVYCAYCVSLSVWQTTRK